jgi:hypothetical protein
MAIQFGAAVLDEYLAPGISSFNEAEVPDLAGKCPQSDHWISNLFLNSLFGVRYNATWKQAAVSFLFRTQSALRAYEAARTKTLECTKAFEPGRPAGRLYFEAVAQWEVVLLNIQIALDLFLKVISPQTKATDDADRIRLAANRIKHFAEDIKEGAIPDLTVPLWLAKDCLKTSAADVTFEELAENLCEMGQAADILQYPSYAPPSPEVSIK